MDTNKLYEIILWELPAPLWITDRAFTVTFVNKAALGALACERESIQGAPLYDLLSEDNPAGLLETVARAADGGTWEGELLLKTSEGEAHRFPVRVEITKDALDETQNYIFLSVSGFKAKPSAQRGLSEAGDESDRTGEAVRKLTHQLNNPLVGVFNFSQLLLEKASGDEELEELARTIHEAAGDCKEIISAWRRKFYSHED